MGGGVFGLWVPVEALESGLGVSGTRDHLHLGRRECSASSRLCHHCLALPKVLSSYRPISGFVCSFVCLAVLGMKHNALYMLGKHAATEPYPSGIITCHSGLGPS